MKKFGSIEQFRNVVKSVRLQHDYKGKDENESNIYLNTSSYPTLKFEGTVKLHGTNGGVVLYKDGTIKYQSRERELSQNKLIEWTLEVENECPVAKKFGVSGIGEGIVFRCVERPELVFKSKGEKHSSSKVKTLNAVDTELLESMKEFVEYACTENRLKQGLEHVEGTDIKNTGDFIRWVVNDILKEESDTLVKNNIEWKKVAPMISKKASNYFRNV